MSNLLNATIKSQHRLVFGFQNTKLQQGEFTFSLPAGKTCPGACDCLAHAEETIRIVDGVPKPSMRIVDGKKQQFRCFAASMELQKPSVYRSRRNNLAKLREAGTVEGMSALLYASIPKRAHIIRVHVGGDFFIPEYFMAWMEAARRLPHIVFYAYTKSLQHWVKYQALVPGNFVLTASRGGRHDHLIDKHNLREAVVVYSRAEAKALKLKIDHDDNCARNPKLQKFALLIHGGQPAGSKAGKATAAIRAEKKLAAWNNTII